MPSWIPSAAPKDRGEEPARDDDDAVMPRMSTYTRTEKKKKEREHLILRGCVAHARARVCIWLASCVRKRLRGEM